MTLVNVEIAIAVAVPGDFYICCANCTECLLNMLNDPDGLFDTSWTSVLVSRL